MKKKYARVNLSGNTSGGSRILPKTSRLNTGDRQRLDMKAFTKVNGRYLLKSSLRRWQANPIERRKDKIGKAVNDIRRISNDITAHQPLGLCVIYVFYNSATIQRDFGVDIHSLL